MSRKGEYFYKELSVTNAGGPVWQSVAASATLTNYGTDNSSGSVYVPPRAETFAHDADGNLTNDGRWSYTWDAENRLVRMETKSVATNAGLPPLRLLFAYDSEGRRTAKGVLLWTNNAWAITLSNRFVYDGWNLVAELNGTNNALIRSYAWGLDISGSMQGAGGVGGLLWLNDTFASLDGNGNVAALITASNGVLAAQYEYGPFGGLLRATGVLAKTNPVRFSTTYCDEESALFYYGYRFYTPHTGRWLSTDPIREKGGLNLYAFVRNGSVNYYDVLGLLVTGVLDRKAFTVDFSDNDSPKTAKAQAFTGGHANSDATIVSPGTGKESPAPAGDYWIVDNPNPIPGHEDWYGLIKKDSRIDDYFDDNGKKRSGVRLHVGRVSWGCVTVNDKQPDAASKWKSIQDLLNGTKTDTIDFITGPHWWVLPA